MYKFKKIEIGNTRHRGANAGFFEVSNRLDTINFKKTLLTGFNGVKGLNFEDLKEVIMLCRKYKNLIFDDSNFFRTKSSVNADFALVLRVFEIICESDGNFWIIKNEKGEIVGFTYVYDIISISYPSKTGKDKNKIKYTTTPHTATLAGCLKKDFWGIESKKIMSELLNFLFYEKDFKKIKCETFSKNPYVTGLLKSFGFRREGVLIEETLSRGKEENVNIWGLLRKEWEK